MKQKCDHDSKYGRDVETLSTWLEGSVIWYEMQVYCGECGDKLHTYKTPASGNVGHRGRKKK